MMKKRTMTSRRSLTPAPGMRTGAHWLLCCTLLTLAIGSAPSSLFAHEQKTAVTRILFNDRTGNIEIMHRFLIHDAEHAASMIFGAGQNLIESTQSRELFGSYVVNRFAIEFTHDDGEQEDVALDYIGEEVDGQFLWIYQELKDPGTVAAMTVLNMALRDVWPDQSNLVNIEREGELFSLSYSDSAEVRRIEF